MAIIRRKELKNMNEGQINQKLNDLKKELMRINTQKSTGTNIENPGRVKELKRTIAKLLTRLNESLEGVKQKT
ncbi:50S ribosomal protein L29 [Candidatus Woesearchaeota archaeon]|nr:50S ribosomal protein L29 [Candidatus Woesearchaeota archaeon]